MSPRWLHWPAATPSGPVLTVHDSFTSGSTTWDGRTPDTINTPAGAWSKPKTSPAFTVDTGNGYGYRSTRSTDGSNGEYKDTIVVPTNGTDFRIVADVQAPVTSLSSHGIGVSWWDSSSTASGGENFVSAFIGFTNLAILREVSSGVQSNLATSNAVTYVAGTRYVLDVLVSGTSATFKVFDSTGLIELLSISSGSVSLSSSANAGCIFLGLGATANYGRIYDLKVYE